MNICGLQKVQVSLFYILVKLHKPDKSLRPVVSTCGTATYNLARVHSKILKPLVKSSERRLKDTRDLIEPMKDVVLEEDEILHCPPRSFIESHYLKLPF